MMRYSRLILDRALSLALALALAVTFAGAAAPAASAQDALPPADQLIERYVEAIGGRDLILSHANSRATGTFSMPAAGISGSMVVEAADGKMVTRVEIPGLGSILSGYDGTVGWSVDPNLGPRLVDGKELAALVEGSSPLASLRDASYFTARETVERVEMGGQACYKVRLVWKSGRETHDCYSVESGLLVGQSADHESPMGAITAITLMEDYREVGGIMTAHRIRQQMLGQEQVMTLERVEYGVVDPSAFALPDVIQTLVEAARDGEA